MRFPRCSLRLVQRRFSSTYSSTAYYDSQSARWITRHDPNKFELTVCVPPSADATRYGTVHTTKGDHLFNKSQTAVVDCDGSFDTVPSNVVVNIITAPNEPAADTISRIRHHLTSNNTRLRATITNFTADNPIDIGSHAGRLADEGVSELFIDNVMGTDVDDLRAAIEEISYVDAEGGAMIGRIGLNFIPHYSELMEECVFDLGVSKLRITEEAHLQELCGLLEVAGKQHDVKK